MTAYRGLVCPGRFHYEAERGFDLAARAAAPVDQPVICRAALRHPAPARAAARVSPSQDTSDAGVDADAGNAARAVAPRRRPTSRCRFRATTRRASRSTAQRVRSSRYAGEVWYYVGDYHFDNARDDGGNALAIAAYQQSMRASERARPVTAAGRTAHGGHSGRRAVGVGAARRGAGAVRPGGGVPAVLVEGALQGGLGVISACKRVSREALRSFAYLLDYYDYVGAEASAQGNRADTIKWIGVIFSESEWGIGQSDEGTRCQQVVETVARPPADAPRPFDCAGIMRIVSPADAMARRNGSRGSPHARCRSPGARRTSRRIARGPRRRTSSSPTTTSSRRSTTRPSPSTASSCSSTRCTSRRRAWPRASRWRTSGSGSSSRPSRPAAASRATPRAARGGTPTTTTPTPSATPTLVARNSLHDTAIQHHQSAGRLSPGGAKAHGAGAVRQTGPSRRRRGQAATGLRLANEEYQAAVQAYTQFIRELPQRRGGVRVPVQPRRRALLVAQLRGGRAGLLRGARVQRERPVPRGLGVHGGEVAGGARALPRGERRQLDPCLAVRAGIPPTSCRTTRATRSCRPTR
jgi:hypothetical protein